jgi:membrane associated rhomboid family serine protease
VVRSSRSRKQADEWAYVLTALGILHELREEPDGGFSVAVLPEDLEAAGAALAANDAEKQRAPPSPAREYGPSLLWLAYGVFIIAFHLLTGPRDEHVIWFARGSADAAAIVRGEWWRPATALTLHADYAHAIGNAVAGAVLFWALARRIGPAASAWLALLAGFVGNELTALVVRRNYVSVGASTAVFAVLGAVAVLQTVSRRRALILPLGAGAALLGLLGTGQDSDLFAHLFGYVSGVLLGLCATPLARRPPKRTLAQPLVALLALAAIAGFWARALS